MAKTQKQVTTEDVLNTGGDKSGTEEKDGGKNGANSASARDENRQKKIKDAEDNAPAYETVRVVTVPLLKMNIGVPYWIKITCAIYEGKEITEGKYKDMGTPQMLKVIDLSTGEGFELIVPTVLGSILGEDYPDDGYVNKCFKITKLPSSGDQSYHTFKLEEVKLTENKKSA